MNISRIITLNQIEDFLQASTDCVLKPDSKAEIYAWLGQFLLSIGYRKLKRKEKGKVKIFLQKVTGYGERQLKRLLKKHRDGTLHWKKWQKGSFRAVYSDQDISLLHHIDRTHRLSGPATKEIIKREYVVFGKSEYANLSHISSSHIYNLRKRSWYLRNGKIFEATKSVTTPIGRRQKPRPNGRPGFFRVDTVHQGDMSNMKGMYHINLVDEVTQTEFIYSVPLISERYLQPILEDMWIRCPFTILNFHSDNGSEYINKIVAGLLNGWRIKQTKSRPRKHNDNALVESKNGSIIRKTFGYFHIPATADNATILNRFSQHWLIPYLNYHRPCGFATTKIDHKGKERKIYDTYMTPYEKLKSLPNAQQYLRRHISFEELDKIAYAASDTEFAQKMNAEKEKAFQKIILQPL